MHSQFSVLFLRYQIAFLSSQLSALSFLLLSFSVSHLAVRSSQFLCFSAPSSLSVNYNMIFQILLEILSFTIFNGCFTGFLILSTCMQTHKVKLKKALFWMFPFGVTDPGHQ